MEVDVEELCAALHKDASLYRTVAAAGGGHIDAACASGIAAAMEASATALASLSADYKAAGLRVEQLDLQVASLSERLAESERGRERDGEVIDALHARARAAEERAASVERKLAEWTDGAIASATAMRSLLDKAIGTMPKDAQSWYRRQLDRVLNPEEAEDDGTDS